MGCSVGGLIGLERRLAQEKTGDGRSTPAIWSPPRQREKCAVGRRKSA